ncbi:DUF3240 family protein [Acidithiobacillus sulfuriphilus]|uniref:DUF3240 family protein n=1 Tax=Acidithiobacillus sulfuriphilus TaxID=1867749 RepID=UPI003F5D7336
MSEEFCLLTLLLPESLGEEVLDILLLTEGVQQFTSTALFAHGVGLDRLDVQEQVLGRARRVQVQALLSATVGQEILARLRARFAGAGLHYWIQALPAAGEI